jgi:hypothetical protein
MTRRVKRPLRKREDIFAVDLKFSTAWDFPSSSVDKWIGRSAFPFRTLISEEILDRDEMAAE